MLWLLPGRSAVFSQLMTLQERQVAIEEFRQAAMLELSQGHEWKICFERWLARWATLFDPPIHYPMPELPPRSAG